MSAQSACGWRLRKSGRAREGGGSLDKAPQGGQSTAREALEAPAQQGRHGRAGRTSAQAHKKFLSAEQAARERWQAVVVLEGTLLGSWPLNQDAHPGTQTLQCQRQFGGSREKGRVWGQSSNVSSFGGRGNTPAKTAQAFQQDVHKARHQAFALQALRRHTAVPPVMPSCLRYLSRWKMGVSMMDTATELSLT